MEVMLLTQSNDNANMVDVRLVCILTIHTFIPYRTYFFNGCKAGPLTRIVPTQTVCNFYAAYLFLQ